MEMKSAKEILHALSVSKRVADQKPLAPNPAGYNLPPSSSLTFATYTSSLPFPLSAPLLASLPSPPSWARVSFQLLCQCLQLWQCLPSVVVTLGTPNFIPSPHPFLQVTEQCWGNAHLGEITDRRWPGSAGSMAWPDNPSTCFSKALSSIALLLVSQCPLRWPWLLAPSELWVSLLRISVGILSVISFLVYFPPLPFCSFFPHSLQTWHLNTCAINLSIKSNLFRHNLWTMTCTFKVYTH